MRKSIERTAARFTDALGELVAYNYCLGAADENEARAATIDFLVGLINELYAQIDAKTAIPDRR